jgi:hypothetical protein
MISTHPCALCAREYYGLHPTLCSLDCQQAQELFSANLGATVQSARSNDPRIFFYDAGFGMLADHWTILCLKRLRTRMVDLQKEIDFHMHRIRKTLETKISTRQPMPSEKILIVRLMQDLLALNSRGWHLNILAHKKTLDEAIRAGSALALVLLSDERAAKIRQLDLLMTGRTHAWKFY